MENEEGGEVEHDVVKEDDAGHFVQVEVVRFY